MQVQKLPVNKSKVKSKKTGSAPETLYRVTLRNQLRNIGIADQKAKILLGINTILISLFIAATGIVSNVAQLQYVKYLDLNIPFMAMMISCFVSAAIAIVAVRPCSDLWKKNNPSQLSFRDFQATGLDAFLEDMDNILSSKESIYKSLNIDLYLYGKCLQRKNQLLKYAFNIFLAGLTIAMISFFILKFNAPVGVA